MWSSSRLSPGLLGDLHVYDPVAGNWTDLSAAASAIQPSQRCLHGVTAAVGKLYVHGGFGGSVATGSSTGAAIVRVALRKR